MINVKIEDNSSQMLREKMSKLLKMFNSKIEYIIKTTIVVPNHQKLYKIKVHQYSIKQYIN